VFENEDPRVPRARQRHPGARRFRPARPEGKIRAAQFARERDVPYFGICLGCRCGDRGARNLVGIEQANSTEFGLQRALVGLMTEWLRGNELESAPRRRSRGTMRLGGIRRCSSAAAGFGSMARHRDFERHRHRTSQYRLQGPRAARLAIFRPVADACCRRSSNMRTIPGSSGCNSIPN